VVQQASVIMSEIGHQRADHSGGHQLVLAGFDDGAVLLDLRSGSFFHLNPSARCVAEGLVRGESVSQLEERLAGMFGLSPVQAAEDVHGLLVQLQAASSPAGNNPLRFQADGCGSMLCWDGVPACHIDHTSGLVTDAAPTEAFPDAAQRLLWTVPHLLVLRGYFVVHASAIQRGTNVIGFAGASGAGKTTLARLFAGQGSVPVAEDLLVVDLATTPPEVYTGSEAAMHRWVKAHAPELASTGRVRTEDLAAAICGPRVPLRELLFPRRVASAVPVIAPVPVGKVEALTLLLENSFAELALPDVWRHVWNGSRQLVEETRIERLEVPEGLELLGKAVADYSRTAKW
jgi:hypothetical protein